MLSLLFPVIVVVGQTSSRLFSCVLQFTPHDGVDSAADTAFAELGAAAGAGSVDLGCAPADFGGVWPNRSTAAAAGVIYVSTAQSCAASGYSTPANAAITAFVLEVEEHHQEGTAGQGEAASGSTCSLQWKMHLAANAGASSVLLLLDSAAQHGSDTASAALLARAALPEPLGAYPLGVMGAGSALPIPRDNVAPSLAVGVLAGVTARRLRALLRCLAPPSVSAPALELSLSADGVRMAGWRQCARRVRALASVGTSGVSAATHGFWRCVAHWPRVTGSSCNRTDGCDGSGASVSTASTASTASLGALAHALLGGTQLPTEAQELRLALELGAIMYGLGALYEAELAFRRALALAAAAPAAVERVARALLGRALLSRGMLHNAMDELQSAMSCCGGADDADGSDLDVGAMLARRAIPAVFMALARPGEALAAHRRDEASRAAAGQLAAAARRRSEAVAEGLRHVAGGDTAAAALLTSLGTDGAPSSAKTALVLQDASMVAFVAQFSGPLPTEPPTGVWLLAPVVPVDGCGPLALDPEWLEALQKEPPPPLPPAGLLLLFRRGGCSFTDKASYAVALAQETGQEQTGSGVAGAPVTGMVVSNDDGQPATIMAGATADVRSGTADAGCALQRGISFEGDNLAAVPVSNEGECCRMCSSVALCARFTMFEGECFMKGTWAGEGGGSSPCVSCISGTPVSGTPIRADKDAKVAGGGSAARLLPAVMVSGDDGALLRQRLQASATLSVRLGKPRANVEGARQANAGETLSTSFRQVLPLLPQPLRAPPCVFHVSEKAGEALEGCSRHVLCSMLPPTSAIVLEAAGSDDLIITTPPGVVLSAALLRALCRDAPQGAFATLSWQAAHLSAPTERVDAAAPFVAAGSVLMPQEPDMAAVHCDAPAPTAEAARALASQWECSPVGEGAELEKASALAGGRGVLIQYGAVGQRLAYRVRCDPGASDDAVQVPRLEGPLGDLLVDWPSAAACSAPSPFSCPERETVGGSEAGLGLGFGEHLRRAAGAVVAADAAAEGGDDDVLIFAAAVAADASDKVAKETSGSLWLAQDAVNVLAEHEPETWTKPRVKACLEALHVSEAFADEDALGWARIDHTISELCCPSTVLVSLLPKGQRPVASEGDALLDALFTTYTQLGVFLDELGAPEASKAHFVAALRQCGPDATGLAPRIALTAPVVSESAAATVEHHKRLLAAARRLPSVLYGASRAAAKAKPRAPIESSAESAWTLTPATMFHWYAGMKALPLNRAVGRMFLELYPGIAGTTGSPRGSSQGPLRIGFVSSFLRVHSVGKLVHEMIAGLNQTMFNITAFAASHFFAPETDAGTDSKPGRDTIASGLRAAVNYVVLPSSLERAAAALAAASLDVLVFPEIGMDAFIYFLAFQRLAPVQAFFWGHPVSPAFPTQSIDYFVSSELFEPEGGGGASEQRQGPLAAQLAREFPPLAVPVGVEDKYDEQLIRMQSLSTHFSPPVAPAVLAVWAQSAANSSQHAFGTAARRQLGLHAGDRLYVCPQTLMKFHPAFDIAIGAILVRDPAAQIVIVYSSQQTWWRERLQRRLVRAATAAGAAGPVGGHDSLTSRLRFFKRLPHAEFIALIAAADVALDPFPWGGGVSTLDSFAAGTPVITAPSLQTVVQLAAGMYRKMGMGSVDGACCIAADIDQYVSMAVSVARNRTLRQEVSRHITASRGRVYDDKSSLVEWREMLQRLGAEARVVLEKTKHS